MNVSLTGKLEKYIASKVASGDYSTNSEVVRDALRALQERDRERKAAVRELRSQIRVGLDQLDRGEFIEMEAKDLPAFFGRIRARGMAKRRQMLRRKSA